MTRSSNQSVGCVKARDDFRRFVDGSENSFEYPRPFEEEVSVDFPGEAHATVHLDVVARAVLESLRGAHPDHGGSIDNAGQRIEQLSEARRVLLAAIG